MQQSVKQVSSPSLDVNDRLNPIARRSSARTSDHLAKIKESTKGIHLYISIPENHGFFLKCVPPDLSVGKLVTKYAMLLPKGADISRYHVFQNGLRVMDEERTLNKLISEMGCLEIKRDLEFELVSIDNIALKVYITDALTNGEGRLCLFILTILTPKLPKKYVNFFFMEKLKIGRLMS
jgi:hypothetical protein